MNQSRESTEEITGNDSTFGMLHPDVNRVLSEIGINKSLPGQDQYFKAILEGRDVLVATPTGSGKSFGTFIAICSRILSNGEDKSKPVNTLVVTPLKSLNRDIYRRTLPMLGERLGISIGIRHGDSSQYARRKQALDPPQILVVTPEMLQAILPAKIMGREHLSHVETVVVDEVHSIADSKRGIQLSIGLERLTERCGKNIQRIGLSATIGSPNLIAQFLSPRSTSVEIVRDEILEKKFDLSVEIPEVTPEANKYSNRLNISSEAAARMLRMIQLTGEGTVLTFTNTRQMSELLGSRLRALHELTDSEENISTEVHHSSLARSARIEAEEQFRNGKLDLVVSTSSLELGIDIGAIDAVIQYMSPRRVETLVQRVGRSGHRYGETSRGYILPLDARDALESVSVCSLALEGNVEGSRIYPKAYDVLMHQVIGILLDRGQSSVDDIFRISRKAYSYRDLTLHELQEILEFARSLRLVWINEDGNETTIKVRRRAYQYYFNNLSTIPDVSNYTVIDVASNRHVGSLDDVFVATSADRGTHFILKGSCWQILSIDDEKQIISVAPSENISGGIPSWEGELTPVSHMVASRAAEILNNEEIPSVSDYRVTQALRELISEQKDNKPNEQRIIIEDAGRTILIHIFLGSRGNEAFGVLLSGLLTTRLGSSVGYKADAYSVRLDLDRPASKILIETLRNTNPEHVSELLSRFTRASDLFTWRLQYVAKRMGIISDSIERKTRRAIRALVRRHSDSIVGDETVNEIFFEKYAVSIVESLLERIQAKEVTISVQKVSQLSSPLATAALSQGSLHVISTKPTAAILKAVKRRIENTQVLLTCMRTDCTWERIKKIKHLNDPISCPRCNRRYISVSHPSLEGKVRKLLRREIQGDELNPQEKLDLRAAKRSADLVLSQESGKRVAFVLAGRGVGPRAAVRILRQPYNSEEEFLEEILREEATFAKNREFWAN